MGYITSKGSGFANVLTVGLDSRSDHTTVQAAVDAAVAAGADASNPWVIRVGPGVPMSFTPVVGVYVYPETRNMSTSREWSDSVPCKPIERYFVPYDMPMVSIIMDDFGAQWLEVPDPAVFGSGVTPFQYALSKGIPVSFAGSISQLNLTEDKHNVRAKLTVAELQMCLLAGGGELLSHSWTHASSLPETPEDIWKETEGSRQFLESLTMTESAWNAIKTPPYPAPLTSFGTTYPAQTDTKPFLHLGAVVGGFVFPGTWPDGRSLEHKKLPLIHAINQAFDYAVDDLFFDYNWSGPHPHRYSITRNILQDGVAENADNLTAPGQRTIFIFHADTQDTDWAKIKTAFDRLADARNSGKLMLVSPRTIVCGIPAPVAGGKWGGIPRGSFEGLTSIGRGRTCPWSYGNNTVEVVDGDLGKCVRMSHNSYMDMNLRLEPGQYTLRYKAKGTVDTGYVHVFVEHRFYEYNQSNPYVPLERLYNTKIKHSVTNTSALVENPYAAPYPEYVPFTVPRFSQAVRIGFIFAASTGQYCYIDDVEVART